MLKIHHWPRARGLRVVWQCEEMGLPYAIVPVTFPLTDEYRKLNPAGGVPFLEDEGGVAINESVAMMLYLAQKYGPSPLLPSASDPLFARVLQLTIYGEATLGMWINAIMLARFYAPEEQKQNWTTGAATERVAKAVDCVSHTLGERPFLAGAGLTLADISVSYALGMWADFLEQTLPENLAAYQARMSARPALQRAAAAR